jgi:hypothetical protein
VRQVEIIEEARSQRRWVAIDMQTGKPVLRLHDLTLFLNICQGFGWEIVPSNPERVLESS